MDSQRTTPVYCPSAKDDTVERLQAEIERLRAEVLGLNIALDRCVDGGTFDMVRDALKPFAGAVFNDNGDMTVDLAFPKYADFCNAYFAMRKTEK